jgi:hypothetical protein
VRGSGDEGRGTKQEVVASAATAEDADEAAAASPAVKMAAVSPLPLLLHGARLSPADLQKTPGPAAEHTTREAAAGAGAVVWAGGSASDISVGIPGARVLTVTAASSLIAAEQHA